MSVGPETRSLSDWLAAGSLSDWLATVTLSLDGAHACTVVDRYQAHLTAVDQSLAYELTEAEFVALVWSLNLTIALRQFPAVSRGIAAAALAVYDAREGLDLPVLTLNAAAETQLLAAHAATIAHTPRTAITHGENCANGLRDDVSPALMPDRVFTIEQYGGDIPGRGFVEDPASAAEFALAAGDLAGDLQHTLAHWLRATIITLGDVSVNEVAAIFVFQTQLALAHLGNGALRAYAAAPTTRAQFDEVMAAVRAELALQAAGESLAARQDRHAAVQLLAMPRQLAYVLLMSHANTIESIATWANFDWRAPHTLMTWAWSYPMCENAHAACSAMQGLVDVIMAYRERAGSTRGVYLAALWGNNAEIIDTHQFTFYQFTRILGAIAIEAQHVITPDAPSYYGSRLAGLIARSVTDSVTAEHRLAESNHVTLEYRVSARASNDFGSVSAPEAHRMLQVCLALRPAIGELAEYSREPGTLQDFQAVIDGIHRRSQAVPASGSIQHRLAHAIVGEYARLISPCDESSFDWHGTHVLREWCDNYPRHRNAMVDRAIDRTLLALAAAPRHAIPLFTSIEDGIGDGIRIGIELFIRTMAAVQIQYQLAVGYARPAHTGSRFAWLVARSVYDMVRTGTAQIHAGQPPEGVRSIYDMVRMGTSQIHDWQPAAVGQAAAPATLAELRQEPASRVRDWNKPGERTIR